ncbi:GGDEF domain-containing protein, partial [Candidatus Sumerlaeota bacterium]|nr:GGDEF domain-containing protein [Candidatus Sumerlaeota bacterium]
SVWLWSDFRTGHHYSSPMVPYWSTLVRLGFFLIVNFTLDSLKRSFAHEKELARTDSLTGLANARAFYAAAEAEFNRSRRTGSRFSVAYLDLDNFKRVNDRFGHNTGDEVLRILGETLRAHIRACDTAARLGGDEFALLFSESDHEEALHALRRIREDTLAEMRARTWPVTLSAGLVTFGQLPDSIDEMVRLVDNLMYEVKNNGKNAIREAIHGGAAELTA